MTSSPGLGFQFSGLFLVLLCSCTGFQGTDASFRAVINSTLQIRASLGQSFRVPCEGSSAFRSSSIYWLANSSFVEDLYPDGVVSEEEARERSQGPGRRHLLCRELFFHSFSERDQRTNFSCVILDPAGPAQKNLTWLQPEENRGSGSGMLEKP
ncbi:interleukin-18-binding protein [Heteronotia binoei]|uniref:interleukin-18-binding protein n=1 Tax=Heteronotia binoei TaxID=13085 RepID=UPI00292D256B|nr:interleukin-18-binding protein [Heteronotia binoei]